MFRRKGNRSVSNGVLTLLLLALLSASPAAAKAVDPTAMPHARAASWSTLWDKVVAWWASSHLPQASSTVTPIDPLDGTKVDAGSSIDPLGGAGTSGPH